VAGRQETVADGDALERQRSKQRIERRHAEAHSSDEIEALEHPQPQRLDHVVAP
jgi:hypothetical protein